MAENSFRLGAAVLSTDALSHHTVQRTGRERQLHVEVHFHPDHAGKRVDMEVESLPDAEDHGEVRLRSAQPRSAGIGHPEGSVPEDLVDAAVVKIGVARHSIPGLRPKSTSTITPHN